MRLLSNQTYLMSRELYADICRLARLRTQFHAIVIEQARLEASIRQRMAPATEIVDLSFLRQQTKATPEERKEMFVAKIDVLNRLVVHPAYVCQRFRPCPPEEPDSNL